MNFIFSLSGSINSHVAAKIKLGSAVCIVVVSSYLFQSEMTVTLSVALL